MGFVLPSMVSTIRCLFWVFCVLCSVGHSSHLQWVRLTKDNFTSDIHTHPFLLCIATVPWCGESRSMMRELSNSIEVDENVHSIIQLRVVYVNFDKSLEVFFFGRKKYPTLTLYQHATPFKYKGKLRVQNILAAIRHAISFNSRDFPFKKLETTSELDIFMESTDKPVILFDFCNYAEKLGKSKHHQVLDDPVDTWPGSRKIDKMEETKLLFDETLHLKSHRDVEQYNPKSKLQRPEDSEAGVLKVEKEETGSSIGEAVLQEDAQVSLKPIIGEDNELPKHLGKDDTTEIGSSNSYGTLFLRNENDFQHQFLSCQPDTDFLSANSPFWMKSNNADEHEKSWSADSITSGVLSQIDGCNRTEYKHFAIVYQNLTKIVRAHALTPEHANFAIIRNKSLLSDLGIDSMQNYTWFLMRWMPDQPHAPRLYLRDETVGSFFSSSEQLVLELNQEMINHHSTFCNKTASVILFIDRASSLLEVRRKSWEALRALRAFARNYVGGENLVATRMDSQMEEKPASEFKSNLIKSVIETQLHTDKLFSLKDLLGHRTVQHATDQPIRVSHELTGKDHSVHREADKHGSNVVLKILVEGEETLQLDSSLSDIISEKFQASGFSRYFLLEDNAIYEVQEGKIVGKVDADFISSSVQGLGSVFPSTSGSFVGSESAKFIEKDIELPPLDVVEGEMAKEEHTNMKHENTLSFYFADGEDQWKDMVLPGLPYPSLVILDSSKGGQFVFPSINQSIDYILLKDFVNQYANNNLQKTYRSESAPRKPRKQVQPPFVNRDFHEVDGVPRVTTEYLLQFLSGSQMLEAPSTSPFDCTEDINLYWKRGALVLFTTPSCGFCKRMELVVREVHWLLTLHLDRSTKDSPLKQKARHRYSTIDIKENQEVDFVEGLCTGNHELEFQEKLPRLLQIDCTSNDCSAFFKSIDQEELYPSVILYPGGGKDPPIIFQGGSTVQEILNFLAVGGKAGTKILDRLQGGAGNNRLNSTLKTQMGCFFPRFSQSIHINSMSGTVRHAYHFTADTNKMPSSLSEESSGNDEGALKPVVYPTVGSVLLATDQLSKASKVFESSSILIVKADGQEGFQGLIFNKPFHWKRLSALDSEIELLVNNTVLCYGGPVIVPGQSFLSLSRLKDLEGFSEVVPGVYFGGPLATMRVLHSIKDAQLEAADFWFFLGHAVWGWQQLLNEIASRSWNLVSYEEGTVHLPLQEWLDGSTISVSDVLEKGLRA